MHKARLKMHKIFLLLVFVFAVSGSNLFAAPAAPIETKVSQPDGSTFMVRARGDEHSNWVETTDGHTVIKVDDIWFYAKRDGNGGIEASNDPVGSLDATQLQQLPLHLAPPRDPSASEPRKIRKLQRPGATATRGPDQAAAQTEAQAVFHTQYVLTILVDYSDIVVTYSDASFAELIYGANNSVKDFFWENSYNRFTFAAPVESFGTADDGIIHVTRPGTHPNQGSNNLVSRVEAQQIVQLADDFIDFASYDASGNGSVSAYELAIVIITAGYETSYSGSGVSEIPSVWGHVDMWTVFLCSRWMVRQYSGTPCLEKGTARPAMSIRQRLVS